jgi:hypothetical protein
MSVALIQKKRNEREQEIVLRLLEHVADDDALSQAKFAKQVGIAKGLSNAYFNRCLQKGWIKLRQVPKQRFLYYLTPKGFAEKASLTAQFLSYSYQFYRDARADLVTTMEKAATMGHSQLAVLGDGELAEIAVIVSDECQADIVGFIAGDSARVKIAGRPVVTSWNDLGEADAAILATVHDAKKSFKTFTKANPKIQVYVPRQLSALVWDK